MSVSQFVFLRDERLPTLAQWQVALDRAGTGVVLDASCDPRSHRGYFPATYGVHDSGFEWYYGPVASSFSSWLPIGVGDRDSVAVFVTFSDYRKLLCATLAAAVLTQLVDGRAYDNGSRPTIDGEEAMIEAREMERRLKLTG